MFNRDMTVNESEQVQNCNNSKNVISDKTIIAHHPFVTNVEEEMKALEEQREASAPEWDAVPQIKDDGNDEE